MSDTLTDLRDYVRDSTVLYRKGDVVEHHDGVTHVYAMPELPDRPIQAVDVHFMVVGFTEVLPGWDKDRLRAALLANPVGEFITMTEEDWRGGPSYIPVGAWIGSQDLALRLFAVGKILGLWGVVTPGALGVEPGPQADQMAGSGFVMASGLGA